MQRTVFVELDFLSARMKLAVYLVASLSYQTARYAMHDIPFVWPSEPMQPLMQKEASIMCQRQDTAQAAPLTAACVIFSYHAQTLAFS